MGGLQQQPSKRLMHVASMGRSLAMEPPKEEKARASERRRSSLGKKKARFEEVEEVEAAAEAEAAALAPLAREGGTGSTFKSRMRDRETRSEQMRIRAKAETEAPIHTRLEDKSKQTVMFPPGMEHGYTPPATAANGIPQTYVSRQIRRAGRSKREIFEYQERHKFVQAPFCAAQRPNTVFEAEPGALGVQLNRRLARRRNRRNVAGRVGLSVQEAALAGSARARR